MTPASPARAAAPILLQFDDNTLLPLLFGEHDRHLARIEQRLGVRLSSRGNRIAIEGPHSAREAARDALLALYDRLRRGLEVDMGGMRGIVAGDKSSTAQLTFTYQGPSKTESPLANGEVRRQIGLKLRAVNTCNLVYVMWHVEPTPGVYVSVKSNPGKSTHAQCGANGYINLRPTGGTQPPQVTAGVKHVLRATLDGRTLRAYADEKLAWEGTLPDVADTLSGPAGVRSDNGKFDFEVALPGGAKAGTPCPPADGGD